MKKTYKSILAISFIIYMSLIIILNLVSEDKKFSDMENRVLEQRPEFTLKHVVEKDFMTDYENYISDQFILRDFWVGIKTDIERVLGKRESNGVFLAKGGYLLEKFEPNDKKINSNIEAINQFASSNIDVKTNFMLIPNSIKILEEKLPSFAKDKDQQNYFDDIKENLNDNVNFIDVYDILDKNKEQQLYYKTDHHWTTRGAYLAYRSFCDSIGVKPYDENEFNIKEVTDKFYGSLFSKSGYKHLTPDKIDLYLPKDDIEYKVTYDDNSNTDNNFYQMQNVDKKDKYTVFLGGNHSFIKISTNVNNKRILVVKDSYANCFIPFLAEHYGEIYVVDLRYYAKDVSDLIKNNGIDNCLILYNMNTFSNDAFVKNINY